MKLITALFTSMFLSTQVYAQSEIRDNPIFPLQQKHVHSSSIVECPNGDFLTCWFHGSGERKADDVVIQGARLQKGSNKWSPVFLMADTPYFPDCNPVLFIDQHDRLWMFWIAVCAHKWEQSIFKVSLVRKLSAAGTAEMGLAGHHTAETRRRLCRNNRK